MQSDAAEESIQRSLSTIGELQPAAIADARGASEEEIRAVESVAGRSFGNVHRVFLKHLGGSMGRLDFGSVDATITALLDAHAQTTGAPPEGYELFAVSELDPYLDMFLFERDGIEPVLGTTYSVIGYDFDSLDLDEFKIVCGSISELLCHVPYVDARYNPKPLKSLWANPGVVEGAMERFNRMVEDRDLKVMWFSSGMTRYVEFGETILIAKQMEGLPLAVSLGSADSFEYGAAQQWLIHDVGLEPGQ